MSNCRKHKSNIDDSGQRSLEELQRWISPTSATLPKSAHHVTFHEPRSNVMEFQPSKECCAENVCSSEECKVTDFRLVSSYGFWWWLLLARAGHRNCPRHLRLSKHIDMTIHWKALEAHFLMVHVPLVFRFKHFQRKNTFLKFFSIYLSP
jgi:hypothetical protein